MIYACIGLNDSYANFITSKISEAAILEQMAEECTELAQVLLKKARKLRGENITPMSIDEIQEHITEEFSDVLLCANILDTPYSTEIMEEKLQRWVDRTSKGRYRWNNEG